MYTHNLDPILLDFGLIVIRWYSLSLYFWNYNWMVARKKNHHSLLKKYKYQI